MKAMVLVAGSLFLFILALASPVRAQEAPLPASAEHKSVCDSGGPLAVKCHAKVVANKTNQKGKPGTPNSTGYTPAQILAAYQLNPTVDTPRTIAVVVAHHHPNILEDVNVYSQTFGLPLMSSCLVSTGTTSRPCLQVMDQRSGTNYPSVNPAWALETALDVEMVHAICQNCNILLVEADSPTYSDLFMAIDTAVGMGVKVISNSYGSAEWDGEQGWDYHLNVPGVAMIFSSGDGGYQSSYPAASPYVVAVGGTTLYMSGNTFVSEKAWGGSGSGCSLYQPAMPWQLNLSNWHKTGCGTKRAIADVSAVADPGTGAAIYSSVEFQGQSGWFKVGGTSLSAPIIAGVYILAQDVNIDTPANSLPYMRLNYRTNIRDISTGSNGHCKRNMIMCNSGNNYDGPTGLGTPLGMTAF